MTISIIRLFTGDDGQSHFETIELETTESPAHDFLSGRESAGNVHFAITPAGGSFDWHCAPQRQYVLTLEGTLEFTNRMGATQVIRPGDILLAEDTTGGGHRWRLVDDRPWRRCYVALD